MLWDPSVLDSEEGIRFWGKTIPVCIRRDPEASTEMLLQECQQVLPAAPDGKEMLPESMLWFLLTGKVPSKEEAAQFVKDLAERSVISPAIEKIIDSFRTFPRELFRATHGDV
jgi:citrate synthase